MNDAKPIAIIAALIVLLVAGGAWWMMRRTEAPVNGSPRAVTATDAPIDKPANRPCRCRRSTRWTGSSVRCSPRCRRGPSWPAGWRPTT